VRSGERTPPHTARSSIRRNLDVHVAAPGFPRSSRPGSPWRPFAFVHPRNRRTQALTSIPQKHASDRNGDGTGERQLTTTRYSDRLLLRRRWSAYPFLRLRTGNWSQDAAGGAVGDGAGGLTRTKLPMLAQSGGSLRLHHRRRFDWYQLDPLRQVPWGRLPRGVILP
jgi:hypothetical protein